MVGLGVGVGTGALGSVIGKLTTLLGDEYTMLKRVRKDIAFLQRELRRMQILVDTLADMEELDELAKDWKGNMRDLSYDMEECIDRFMLRLGNGDARPRFVKKTARRLKTLFERHGIGSQIKDLKARVAEEGERRQRLKLDDYIVNQSRPVVIDPRLAAFHGVAKGLVAIDGRRDKVISWLMEESKELKVVAIVGGGGLGKTTLAMEIYRKIGGDYQCRASVSVSRTLDLEKLLKDVLSQIDEAEFSKCQSERWEKDQLIRHIQLILTEKRYFLVIDDLWKVQDWEFIKAAFPDNYNGSRIIATTRIANVARSCCSNSSGQLYQMLPLNDFDSRRLFFKRIFDSESLCPSQLEKVSARILKKCGGMPLAIITIASLLANKPPSAAEWERLQDSIGAGLSYDSDDGGKGMAHILLLSYWDLPHHLKTCLLYLCIYPEDAKISCEELKWKWIAEGFITSNQGNLYQEAVSCFNELVNRSMIQIVDVDSFEEKYCQVHDMVLDLIISRSAEENFATVLNGVCNSLPTKIRRLSLQSSGLEQKVAIQAITRSKLHVRSLNVFGETKEIPPLVDFLSLRVFDISEDYFLKRSEGYFSWENKHIRNIGSFHQLRYLRMHGLRITELPADIGKLQNLETLELRSNYCFPFKLPSTIARLGKLVRLFINNIKFVFSADMFGSMRALEEVSDICNVDNPEKFLEELGHLTKLRKISMSSWMQPGDLECYRERLESSLNKLGKCSLQYLRTNGDMGNIIFRDPCCTFPHLQHLKLENTMEKVPKGMASLTNLLKLEIEVKLFDEEGLHILMGMPSLAYLRLTVGVPGIMSPMIVSSNGFKLLEVFHFRFRILPGKVGIEFAAGAMPALRRLHLFWHAFYIAWMSSDSAGMGIQHLSSLAQLQVETWCASATLEEVEALEGPIEKAVTLHPNRQTLQFHLHREYEGWMYKDEEERSRGRRSATLVEIAQEQEDQVI
uniref:Coiled-coil nucleotide-binding leucine-rich repeat (CC-NB-LRR) immune receptor n=1 Tax=Triticum aestivum TaxID=4565 RepID=A0A7R8R541_WHEAT|nr:coiled-coil nucleotide-binding leucine-rich repeat (CC-NB-LRR) immune receptor [Triticum aestivum]CAD1803021.1 NB-LRR protein [Triticum aestivum]